MKLAAMEPMTRLAAGAWRDARYALRGMRRRPRFAVLSIATLALGIGVNVTSVAVAHGILVRPLPYAEPSRVVIINLLFPDGGDLGFSANALREWLSRLTTVETAAGYFRREVTVRVAGRSTVVPAAVVTDEFFSVLGTPAAVGRLFSPGSAADVVVGQRALREIVSGDASDPVGVPVSISDESRAIGAVMPSDFAFPDDQTGLWLPSSASTAGSKPASGGYSKVVARLKPGVTLAHLREDANRVRLELNPSSQEIVSIDGLGESVVGGLRRLLTLALAGALLVLLVACANVATLFIGRDVARQRELAARKALGATTPQLVRSVLVETSLIAAIASVIGTVLGAAMLQVFVSQAASSVSGLHRVTMGLPLAVAIAVLTIVVSLICSVAPALHAARTRVSPFLRAGSSPGRQARRMRAALVVAQIALACVLLIGAGLLTRTVSALLHEDHGFRPAGVLEAKIVLSDTVLFDGPGRAAFVPALLERVRSLPGVLHAGVGSNLPPQSPAITMAIRLVRQNQDETRMLKVGTATPGYLRALGARFIDGRDFDEADAERGVAVVILSESVARFYFPGEDAVGRTITRMPAAFRMPGEPRVIGVVSDIKYEGLDSPASGAVYMPWAFRPLGRGYLLIRTAGDPMGLAPAIRAAAQAIDPTVPVPEIQSLEDAVARSIAARRVRALPAIGFGLLALAVALVGVLATMTTLVAEGRRDLAIRAALGASPSRLVRTIVGHGLALTAAGVALGLSLGGVAARSLASLVYGVSPYDPATFAGTAAALVGGAALMTYAAALRACSVDPLAVLEQE
jgi:putative ABC transport system permease protein